MTDRDYWLEVAELLRDEFELPPEETWGRSPRRAGLMNFDWDSFWDNPEPSQADGDYRFWKAVLTSLEPGRRSRSEGGKSLWERSNPWRMARMMLEVFGVAALVEAVQFITLAEKKDRPADSDFWLEVAAILRNWTGTA